VIRLTSQAIADMTAALEHVSTDLPIRILASFGYRVKVSVI
jgi:hypothetical protein